MQERDFRAFLFAMCSARVLSQSDSGAVQVGSVPVNLPGIPLHLLPLFL